MTSRPGRRQSYRQIVNCDLELRPLMNVFIVLIPMLLLSAVFIEIRVIEMSLPRDVPAEQKPAVEPMELTIHVRSGAYIVEANGTVLGSFPRETTAIGAASLSDDSSARMSEALARVVLSRPDHKEIRIVAEATTKYEEIVALMDLARAAGLPHAALEGSGV